MKLAFYVLLSTNKSIKTFVCVCVCVCSYGGVCETSDVFWGENWCFWICVHCICELVWVCKHTCSESSITKHSLNEFETGYHKVRKKTNSHSQNTGAHGLFYLTPCWLHHHCGWLRVSHLNAFKQRNASIYDTMSAVQLHLSIYISLFLTGSM